MALRCLWSVSVCDHYESVNYHFGPLVRTRMVNVERSILVAKPRNIQAQLALVDQGQCQWFLQRSFHRIHLAEVKNKVKNDSIFQLLYGEEASCACVLGPIRALRIQSHCFHSTHALEVNPHARTSDSPAHITSQVVLLNSRSPQNEK